MSAHLLATAIVALAGLKLAGAAGSLYVTVLMRRALTAPAQKPTAGLQQVHALANEIVPTVGTGIPGGAAVSLQWRELPVPVFGTISGITLT